MVMTDPIADMLTRMRNGIMARHEYVDVPYSNVKIGILKILKEEGYIKNYKVFVDENKKKVIKVYLGYDENGESVISGLKRISKPGRRIYVGAKEAQKLKNHVGFIILSTNKGIISDVEARKLNVGGEALLHVW
ncbi:MAG: 30S ribosomal protein S8 [Desulfobacterota bacterium]|nr:30S ribosomal protein S8 [Thermodesulfobacteriota bacterium]MDW8002388.1 30S ribosomal protein S8 [Deltaproteobacteria bacterium]